MKITNISRLSVALLMASVSIGVAVQPVIVDDAAITNNLTTVDQAAHIARQETGVLSSSFEAEAEAMQAIDAATYVDRSAPTIVQTFNAWNLHVCTQQCDTRHASDVARLYGHPTVHGIPFDQVTFSMCNREYVRCNQACQAQYEKDMLHWPPPNTDWKFMTSSGLTLCVGNCNAEAMIDHQYIANSTYKPPNIERDADLAFCYRKISSCSRDCQLDFDEEMKEFQRQNND